MQTSLYCQSNQENINNSNKKKLSTPSLLFCKSASRSPSASISRLSSISRLESISPQNRRSHLRVESGFSIEGYFCETHKNKKAVFVKKTENQELYFCQKCAITLASQGHSVTKIENSTNSILRSPESTNENQARQREVDFFLKKLQKLKSKITDKKNIVKENLILSEQFYGEQIEEIDDYFKLIYQSLELEKNKCYNYILNERKVAEQSNRLQHEHIEELNKNLQKIHKDIEENIETVYNVEDQVYRSVITHYEDQYNGFECKINRFQIENIQLKKIEFAGVPESIHSLSEIVIQNSMSVSQSKDRMQYAIIDSNNFDQYEARSQQQSRKSYLVQQSNLIIGECDEPSSDDFVHQSTKKASDNLKFSFEADPHLSEETHKGQEIFHKYLQLWN